MIILDIVNSRFFTDLFAEILNILPIFVKILLRIFC